DQFPQQSGKRTPGKPRKILPNEHLSNLGGFTFQNVQEKPEIGQIEKEMSDYSILVGQ
ncbi:hypothetical protein CLV31_101461, partial [Algoriphagus aquaeductus]